MYIANDPLIMGAAANQWLFSRAKRFSRYVKCGYTLNARHGSVAEYGYVID